MSEIKNDGLETSMALNPSNSSNLEQLALKGKAPMEQVYCISLLHVIDSGIFIGID